MLARSRSAKPIIAMGIGARRRIGSQTCRRVQALSDVVRFDAGHHLARALDWRVRESALIPSSQRVRSGWFAPSSCIIVFACADRARARARLDCEQSPVQNLIATGPARSQADPPSRFERHRANELEQGERLIERLISRLFRACIAVAISRLGLARRMKATCMGLRLQASGRANERTSE